MFGQSFLKQILFSNVQCVKQVVIAIANFKFGVKQLNEGLEIMGRGIGFG